jgi:hypothetical protein
MNHRKIIIYEHSHDDPTSHRMCVPRKIEYGISQADSLLVIFQFNNVYKPLDIISEHVTDDDNDIPLGESVDVYAGQMFTIKYEDETCKLVVGSDNPRDSAIFSAPPAIYNTTLHSSNKCFISLIEPVDAFRFKDNRYVTL